VQLLPRMAAGSALGGLAARVVLPGESASQRRGARASESTRAAKPPNADPAAIRGSSCTLCGALVTPDGRGHDLACWGIE